ncbi:MAG: 3'-5' exonuclease [Candidatus Methylacidiphilales bacterium]
MSLPLTINKEDLQKLPLLAFDGRIHLPRAEADIRSALESLSQSRLVGFDTETRPSFRKGQVYSPSLIQFSTETDAYLFQIKQLETLAPVLEWMESREVIKTGVAVDRDLKDLQALMPFSPAGFLDLGTIARKAGMEKTGLRNLCGILLGHRISKRAQTSNWARTELTPEQILYAATDAWVSLKLCQRLRQQYPELFE